MGDAFIEFNAQHGFDVGGALVCKKQLENNSLALRISHLVRRMPKTKTSMMRRKGPTACSLWRLFLRSQSPRLGPKELELLVIGVMSETYKWQR